MTTFRAAIDFAFLAARTSRMMAVQATQSRIRGWGVTSTLSPRHFEGTRLKPSVRLRRIREFSVVLKISPKTVVVKQQSPIAESTSARTPAHFGQYRVPPLSTLHSLSRVAAGGVLSAVFNHLLQLRFTDHCP